MTRSVLYAPVTGALLGLAAVVEFARPGEPGFRLPLLLCVVTATAPLMWRRHHPAAVGTVVTVAALLSYAAATEFPVSVAIGGAVGCYLLARERVLHPVWLSIAAVLALVAATWLGRDGITPPRLVTEPLAPALGMLAAVAAGDARRSRRERDLATARAVETGRREAATAERARIARELHDIVAHSVSMIAVQAETATYTTPDLPPAGRDNFAQIATSARITLRELRQLVSIVRDDPAGTAPAPTLADLPELIAQHRAAGGTAELTVTGPDRALPAVVELSAYRIVQEALTNARRHAPGARVEVRIERARDTLTVRVADDGPGAGGCCGGGGHGLVGMHERVALLGGRLSIVDDDGFAVTAALPVTRRTST